MARTSGRRRPPGWSVGRTPTPTPSPLAASITACTGSKGQAPSSAAPSTYTPCPTRQAGGPCGGAPLTRPTPTSLCPPCVAPRAAGIARPSRAASGSSSKASRQRAAARCGTGAPRFRVPLVFGIRPAEASGGLAAIRVLGQATRHDTSLTGRPRAAFARRLLPRARTSSACVEATAVGCTARIAVSVALLAAPAAEAAPAVRRQGDAPLRIDKVSAA